MSFYAEKDDFIICFDIFKAAGLISTENKIIYDIKILYDLEGKETENFKELAVEILGRSRVANYNAFLDKKHAYEKSYKISKINWNKFPLTKLIPQDLVNKISKERNDIILQLFERSEEREFYKKFYSTLKCLASLSRNPVYIDLNSIQDDTSYHANTIRAFTKEDKLYLHFNPVGAKTGRLSFRKGSVNLYTLPKDLRRCIIAPPGFSIAQFDFKSFQPRLAIFSTNDANFKDKFMNIEDIYSVFPGNREENKISFISWMFSKKRHSVFDKEAYPIMKLRQDLYFNSKQNKKLTTRFGRNIHYTDEEENVVFQNYITATEVDSVLEKLVQVFDFLSNKKSKLVTSFHDCLILYLHEEEMNLIDDIKKMMNKVSAFECEFPVSVSVGKNFRDMEKV